MEKRSITVVRTYTFTTELSDEELDTALDEHDILELDDNGVIEDLQWEDTLITE